MGPSPGLSAPLITHWLKPRFCDPFTMALDKAQLLKGKGGNAVPASDLWKDSPALVVVLRRPGCRETMHDWAA